MSDRDRWDDAGGRLCAEIEGWCPCDPDVPDAEIDAKKGRKCGKAETLAAALREAFEAGRKEGYQDKIDVE